MRIPDLARVLEMCPPPEEAATDASPVHDLRFTEYQPYSVEQQAFHNSMAKYRWARGGLGSGKSRVICEHLNLYLAWANARRPVRVLFAANTYRHMMDNALPVLRQAIPPEYLMGGTWETGFRRGSMTIHYANGSEVLLRTAHNKKYQQWRGPEFAAMVMDEGRNFPNREPWMVGIARLRYPGVPSQLLQAWVGSTTNGYDWLYHEFHGRHTTPKHEDFLMLTRDNPYLPEGYYEDLRASMDEDEARQELDGAFVSREGVCYPKLSLEEFPAGNLILGQPNPKRPTDLAIDWGYRNPRVLLTQVYSIEGAGPNGDPAPVRVVVGEWSERNGRAPRNKTIGDLIEWVVSMRDAGWRFRKMYCDPAGDAANEHAHTTSVQQFHAATKIPHEYPRAPWQRIKATGESLVRAMICAADGRRRLAWLGRMVGGEATPYAPRSYEAHRDIQFPPIEHGRPQGDTSVKDGVTDHDTDALRYQLVCLYGRPPGQHKEAYLAIV